MKRRFRAILRSRRARVTILVLVSLLILGLSLMPRPIQVLKDVSYSDKIEHCVAYMVLAFCMCGAFMRKGYLPLILTIVVCAAYGGMIEIVQPFMGRMKDALDFVADVSGATIGAMLSGLVFRMIPPRKTV